MQGWNCLGRYGFITVGLFSASVLAAGIDVGFKIDESGSMGDDIAAVKANVQNIANSLPAGSHAGVVGFGDGNGGAPVLRCDLKDLGSDLAGFQACVNGLIASGSREPGYDAIIFATQNFTFTPGSPYCNILISDEPSNHDVASQQDAIDAMTAVGGIFFGITPTGGPTTSYEPIATATGGTMFDLAAFKSDPTGVLNAVLQACVVAASDSSRMTGGGRFDDGEGNLVSHGFELHCNKDNTPNNLEVNWGGNQFHLETLLAAQCSDNPNYDEGKPVAGFDTYIGRGLGRLNGESGAKIRFKFTDQGEPGKGADTVSMEIRDSNNQVIFTTQGVLNQGNQQAHP